MENNMRDIQHCEEQLRSTLYCDDKEKLRRKLVMLQREYLRTAQRLQRAERLDAVRRHVRSRITQHNHQEQEDPEVTSNSCLIPSLVTINTDVGTAQDEAHDPRNNEGPAHCDSSKRSHVIRFSLPSDNGCPQTPDLSHIVDRGHRPSPALRLRSRRSRLRWESRSTETEKTTDNSEEKQEQSEIHTIEDESENVKLAEKTIVNESEELFSASGSSGSPSLLLTHWNTHKMTETGDADRLVIQECQEQGEKETKLTIEENKQLETTSLLIKKAKHTQGSAKDCTQKRRIRETGDGGGICGEDSEIRPCIDNHMKNNEQNVADKTEKSGSIEDRKSVGLLDSCTLVEGLLFPAEYYVRTTRRMTFSQSQPDMQAVILSQLTSGRQRRSRGRGRGIDLKTNAHNNEPSDEQTQTDFSPQATTSIEPPTLSEGQAAGSQNSSEISEQISDIQNNINVFSSSSVCTNRAGRGRRRKRGRGRGRPPMQQSSLSSDNSHSGLGQNSKSSQPTRRLVSPSLSLQSTDGPAFCLPSQEGQEELKNDPLPAINHSATTQLSSENNEALSTTVNGHMEKIYPIFLKSNIQNNRPTQTSKSTLSWQNLLLPASPTSQTCLGPLPCQSLGSLARSLMKLDIQLDFHLPDDQFASLKLHKLRQVAIDSEVESFMSPYNTRNSKRLFNSSCVGSGDQVIQLPQLFSPTPPIKDLTSLTGDKQGSKHCVEQNLANQSLAKVAADTTETPGEQRSENLNPESDTCSKGAASLADGVSHSVSRHKKHRTAILNSFIESSCTDNTEKPISEGNVYRQLDEVKLNPSQSDKQTMGVHSLEEQSCKNLHLQHKTISKSPQGTAGEMPYSCTAEETCNDIKDASVHPNEKSHDGPFECKTTPVRNKLLKKKLPENQSVPSQLLQSPSATCTFISPHLTSCSPTLPSLGLTPHPAASLTSSPSAPSLMLPPPHSPSLQVLSPPILSPCSSVTSLPSHLPTASLSSQNPFYFEQCHKVDPHQSPTLSSHDSEGLVNQVRTKEPVMRSTHTLKTPAGSCLVDACCLPGHSDGLCVAAAGKWAVCLWSLISASDWSLRHTWTFDEPVINVFPVLDAHELMCVTLGQLEIREVRVLSSSSLSQVLLYEGVVQAVVAVSKSRVVLSFHSATGSTLQMFDLSDVSRAPISQHLVSPGVCISALAPVDGLSDALIGTDECGHLFIWNLKTRQLLQEIILGEDFSHTACLRGYSYCGVLFILLQHQLLSSPEEEEKEAKVKDQMFSGDEKEAQKNKTAFFSLVAVNPISRKSVLATKLYPPKAWSGRLCEADVHGSSVVGLSQSGCVCAWDLIGQRDPQMVSAPESEGWQLARWGGANVLVTGHHNGDVTLHCYSHNSLCC